MKMLMLVFMMLVLQRAIMMLLGPQRLSFLSRILEVAALSGVNPARYIMLFLWSLLEE